MVLFLYFCPKICAMRGLRSLMILPVLLLLGSMAIGFSNYLDTKEEMHQDLNCALRQFVMDESQQLLLLDSMTSLRQDMVLTLSDVENSFRCQLTCPSLKDTSHVSVCLLRHDSQEPFQEEAFVCSDTLLWHSTQQESSNSVIALKAYANPSLSAVLGHSDQRIPLTGLILCLLLFLGMGWKMRMTKSIAEAVAISTQSSERSIRLTPMQEQLMDMFATAPNHTLSKETICAALWPRKEQPENTLYTFISRLKTALKEQSDMEIVNKRGREYQLVRKTEVN